MLDFKQVQSQYPDRFHVFGKALLREFLQYKILQAIFESKMADKLAFLGGTALRIVHGNNRFSEDIDLDNFGLNRQEFEELIKGVKRFLELEGFVVKVRIVSKRVYRCYIKFPDLLYKQKISPYREEKILIQIDTIGQGFEYKPEIKILNKFDVFTEIRVTPVDVLLSQKIYTAVSRNRVKGRDFYDISFLLGLTKPNYKFLSEKMGIKKSDELKKEFLLLVKDYDFKKMSMDVRPFLISETQVKRVESFVDWWKQVDV